MNEPRRLSEGSASDLERALLNAGTSYRGSAHTRAKALAAVGLASSATIVAGSIGAGSVASAASMMAGTNTASLGVKGGLLAGLKLTAIKTAALSLAVAVTTVPVGYYVWHRSDAPTASHSAGKIDPGGAPVTNREPEAPTAPIQTTAPAYREAARASRATAVPSAALASRSPSNVTLKGELAALDAARSALASGKPAGALSALDTYSRQYPHGRLELEADVLRIAALANGGRAGAAKKQARAFLRRHPDSVFAPRVRHYLDN